MQMQASTAPEPSAAKSFHSGNQQKGAGRKTDLHILLADLKRCSRSRNIERGKQVHARAVECGHDSSVYLASALISMYARCGSMVHARQVFDSVKDPNVVCWNALILGYADNEQGPHALELFTRMRGEGFAPDSLTFTAALKACSSIAVNQGARVCGECLERGAAIHKLAVESGCDLDIFVRNTLIDLYAKCGRIAYARQVFDATKKPDVVSWNALILGYADLGEGLTALELFNRMRSEEFAVRVLPDSVTFIAALKACISLVAIEGGSGLEECRDRGKEIHEVAVQSGCSSDIYVQNTLIDMYANFGDMAAARRVFESIKHPNVVSWTALILGYADNGDGASALELFTRMRIKGPAPDSVAFAGALKACTLLGALEFGRGIHSQITEFNVILVTCLVDFYAKCGSLAEAKSVFDSHPKMRDMITWNALLAGFSSCGDERSVFELLEGMEDAGFRPDGITFLCVLACCNHAGLVEKGKECFDSMPSKYGIAATVEHYNCMLDLLGRANKLSDAMNLLEKMPCSPNDVTWMTILDACRKWGNGWIGLGQGLC